MKKQLELQSKSLSKTEVIVVAAELRNIEQKYGIITPKIVVEKARPEGSPLHRYFEWDNLKAADRFREWQARALIGAVLVTDISSGEGGPVIRAFVNIKATAGDDEDENVQGYVSTETALKSKPMKEQILQYAHGQLLAWHTKFGAFQEFFGVSQEIRKIQL